MKRFYSLLMVAIMAVLVVTSAFAGGKAVKISQVPTSIKSFVKTNFAPATIVAAEKEVDDGCITYDLKLSDGVKVEITENGVWTEVDATKSSSAVPPTIIGRDIMKYVLVQYPGSEILKIENDDNGYEVTLGDGTELEFDQAYNFLRVDK